MSTPWDKLINSRTGDGDDDDDDGGATTEANKVLVPSNSKSFSRISIVSNRSANSVSVSSDRRGFAHQIHPKEEPDVSDDDVTCPNNGRMRYTDEDATFFGTLNYHLSDLSKWSLSKKHKSSFSAPPSLFRYRQTRFSSRRVRRRVVFKHGDCNVVQGNVAKRRRRYLQDIFTTLVDAQWRWTLLVFALNFILSWLAFAVIWWLIVVSHGDFESHTSDTETSNVTWIPCVEGVKSFTSLFLFSVETQHTIGYGAKHITEECPEAIFIMCLQSIVGVMIQAFMVGIVFAKLSRPKKRTQTLLFSRNAVICQRNGQLCLMFRVGDMRKSHIIEAHVRAQLIKKKVTKEGEILPFFQHEMKVGGDGAEDRIFFIWPTTIVHKITPSSPLYKLSAADMLQDRFEIVVILEGVIESTGMTTQARSSYLPNEILWGHRFANLVSFKKETGEHEVDYSQFNNTYEVDTPLCSAYSLDLLLSGQQSLDGNLDVPSTESASSNECPPLTPSNSTEQIKMPNDSIIITLQPTSEALVKHPDCIPGPESNI